MKKLIYLVIGIVMLIVTTSWTVSSPTTLYYYPDDDVECKLNLYSNGKCYLFCYDTGAYGKYDCNGKTIAIEWDGGGYVEGSINSDHTTIYSVTLNGMKYIKK